MSEELNRKQYQPFHGLGFMEANWGNSIPVYDFFEHVFNMDKAETDQLFEDCKYPPGEALARRAVESLEKRFEADIYRLG